MRVKDLVLEDFRGFGELKLPIPWPVCVLAGPNGSGKSSVLEAIASLLSVVPGLFASRLTSIFKGGELSSIRPGAERSVIDFAAELCGRQVGWSLIAGLRPDLPPLQNPVADLDLADPKLVLPVLAFFHGDTTSLPWRCPPYDGTMSPRLAAYEQAFDAEVHHLDALRAWWESAENYENAERIRRGQLGWELGTLRAVRRAVLGVLAVVMGGELSNMRIIRSVSTDFTKPTPGRLALDKGGVPLFLDQLSAGERRVVSLVADLARRMVIANPELPDPLQTPGVLVLDEIETHLHPSWQRRFIPALRAAFPELQLIVSTHSPQVLGSAPRDAIVVLDRFQVVGVKTATGLDSGTILRELMGDPGRDAEVQRRLDVLFEKLDRDPVGAAVDLDGLEEELGADEPELVRARTLLALLES